MQSVEQKANMKKYDVIVAGGGTAGFMAAAASARQGAKDACNRVFQPALRGPFLGIVSGSGEVVNRGMIEELHDRLKECGASYWVERGTYWNTPDDPDSYEFGLTPFDPEYLKYIAQEMVLEAEAESS